MKKIGSERANTAIRKLKGVDEDMLTSLVTVEEENKLIYNNGLKNGIKSGIKTGIKNGEKRKKIEIIRNMIKENLPIDLISKITGTSKKEIKEISRN